MTAAPILEVRDLSVRHGKRAAVDGVSFNVAAAEVLLILGHNGAGKTTLLSTLFGLLPAARGRVLFRGADITGRQPSRNVADGIAYVPQGHGIFRRLSVRDNLMLGGFSERDKSVIPDRMAAVHDLFPILKQREAQLAGTLSGGQQQMLAIGIALMHAPSLLILDEPSIGLAPNLVASVMDGVRRINREMGATIVLVEQNIEASLPVAGCAMVMKTGRTVYEGDPAKLADRPFLMTLF